MGVEQVLSASDQTSWSMAANRTWAWVTYRRCAGFEVAQDVRECVVEAAGATSKVVADSKMKILEIDIRGCCLPAPLVM